jgi:hypothetical protein
MLRLKNQQDIASRANIAKTSKLIYEYENIVVGSSLTAALFAFKNGYPMVFTEADRPFRFDFLEPNNIYENLKIPATSKEINTFSGVKQVGVPKEILWERLMFLLSMDSKIPLSNLCNSIRNIDGTIGCFNEYSKIAELKYVNCFYFGDNNANGFVSKKDLAEKQFLCYDWIAFNRGGKHEIDYIETDDEFVKQIWFYPSDRIDGNTAVKDACAVSVLSESDMLDFNYSETMARFKLVHEMEARGMKGKFNGYGPNGKPKYYKFRTTSIARTKHQRANSIKPQSEHVKIPQVSEEDLLENLQQTQLDTNRFLRWL